MDNQLHILEAEIKNFKNISHRKIEFDGKSVIIAGPNQAGKSSLIQAICSPVNSKFVPLEPIKQGEEKGHVQITIGGTIDGEDVKYNVTTYFTPGNKRGRLVLEDANEGVAFKGGEKGILESIVGDISFDILEFVRLGLTDTGRRSVEGVRKQIEILKSIMPKDVTDKIFQLDQEKQEKYDERTDVNREIKYLKSKLDKSPFTQEEIEKYSEPLSAGDIADKISKATKKNNTWGKCSELINSYPDDKEELENEIAELEAKIKKKKEELSTLEENNDTAVAWITKNPNKVDTSELHDQLQNISSHNTKCEQVKEYDQIGVQLKEKEKEAESLSERLKAIEEEKKELFSGAKMPVKGLAFDEDNVTFRGLPLSDGNIPTSQLIGIGLKIGMALNPNLRLLVIRDGSLLDDKTMNFILDTCQKKGYQLLIEVVKHEGGELSVEFIED